VLVAFLWGAVPATYLMGLPANTAILALYGKLFGPAWAHDFAAGLTAPFTEATAELVLLWYTFRLAAPPEREWTRATLAPEVERGVLVPAELDAVSSLRFLRRPGRRRVGRHLVAAGHDLVKALARAGGGDSEEVRHARAEVARFSSAS
jgi:hypothetical protein